MLDSFYEWLDDFSLECDNGRGYVSIAEPLDVHIESAENVGHELTFNPRVLSDNIEHLLRNYPDLSGCVDTAFHEDCLHIDFFIGENIADEKQLEDCFNRAWGAIATVLNSLDPGSFGSAYLFDMQGMTTLKGYDECPDCEFCGEPLDYCLGGHEWIEEN
ncbi:gp94 [Corynebacterium phage P1201]|uniref:Gp94 n=1 Tax=Corynebacterium phage P1201 TaxID=384848 RepID=A7IYG1_9CAUD|nr:gp94 [Corynebacterium phage P1201]ABF57544.1 gp94 [Corynebacterium phage P1201]